MRRLLLALMVLGFALSIAGQPALAGGSIAQPEVITVFVDFDNAEIVINGINFKPGQTNPSVFLGGDELDVSSASNSQ